MQISQSILLSQLLIVLLHQSSSTPFFARHRATRSLCHDPSTTRKQEILHEFRQHHDGRSHTHTHNNREFEKDNVIQMREPHAISIRSTCPWKFQTWRNDDLYPHRFWQAVCECEKCVGSPRNKCEPVTINRAFVHRTDEVLDNGECQWVGIMVPVSVGCTCVRPKVINAGGNRHL